MTKLTEGQVSMQVITTEATRQRVRVLAAINGRDMREEVQAALDAHLAAHLPQMPANSAGSQV